MSSLLDFNIRKGSASEFPLNVLFVEDNPGDLDLCLRALRNARFEIEFKLASTAAEFVACLRSQSFDVILADYNLGNWTGLDALELLRRTGYDIPFILVTGALGEAIAVECFRFGITDYVLKDNLDRLSSAVFRALQGTALRNERKQSEAQTRANELKFRALADALPTAVFIEQGTRCCYANRAAEKLTGFSHEELLASNFWQLIASNSRRSFQCCSSRTGEAREALARYRADIVTKAGEVRQLDIAVANFRLDGGLATLVTALEVVPFEQTMMARDSFLSWGRASGPGAHRTSANLVRGCEPLGTHRRN
jgi:PAS domain S-box-containing protein